MRASSWIGPLLLVVLSSTLNGQESAFPLDDLRVSSQGRFEQHGEQWTSTSGAYRLEASVVEGDAHHLDFNLRLYRFGMNVVDIPRVRGSAFFVTDDGKIVVIDPSAHNPDYPSRVSVLDDKGRVLHSHGAVGLTQPTLSADGRHFAYRTKDRCVVWSLETFEERDLPYFDVFAVGKRGRLVGATQRELHIIDADERVVLPLEEPARHIRFTTSEEAVFVLTKKAVERLDLQSANRTTIFVAERDAELRDMQVRGRQVAIGQRRQSSGRSLGEWLAFSEGGLGFGVQGRLSGRVPFSPSIAMPLGNIPWPLLPHRQHPVGNTYGEFQDYGSEYLHPGVDVMGPDREPVYSVSAGIVKAILTTSGSLHWRVAIGDKDTLGASEGYLYAHLEQSSIAVDTGDWVVPGQYLGDLVPWPVASFTHLHFSRIEDTGRVWGGSWLCTDNPHLDFWPQTDSSAPVFLPAVDNDLFAFCRNETSTYLNPLALNGRVDIVARVGDTIESSWVCTVQTIRYSIYPSGDPQNPVVDDRLAINFDMALDTYQGGPIDPFLVDLLFKEDSTCNSEGDYDDREFFHIITNSDGDEIYDANDAAESWNTTAVPNGEYVIEVTARDVAGNETTVSMRVTVAN